MMNQEKLKRVNEINKDISEIEEFLNFMERGRGRLEILSKKSVINFIHYPTIHFAQKLVSLCSL